MRIGTRSILFGAHQFAVHPWFVALAWWKLYGFPFDPRLWVAFFVHDLGYWGKPNMDGPEGEWHVAWGAGMMGWLFDEPAWYRPLTLRDVIGGPGLIGAICRKFWGEYADEPYCGKPSSWYQFCFYHSRYLAKQCSIPPSKLCYADKLAFCITPRWIYLPLVWMTGEWREYAAAHVHETGAATDDLLAWYNKSVEYVRAWVNEHKGGAEDKWTIAKPGNGAQAE